MGIKYQIIQEFNELKKFEERIEEALNDGWIIQGNLQTIISTAEDHEWECFIQPMTKEG